LKGHAVNNAFSSKQLVRGVFEGADLPRLPVIPWVFTHAARLEQVPVRRMYSDPSQYVKCLQNSRKLYGYDAIISCFDASLEAEICGCTVTWGNDNECPVISPGPAVDFNRIASIGQEDIEKAGRFRTVIESFRRINMVSGPTLAMTAVVTGPVALTSSILGKDPVRAFTENPDEAKRNIELAAGFLLKQIQVYCQLEPDIIAVADSMIPLLPPEHLVWLNSALSPILNTVRFYNAFSVLLPGELPHDPASLVDLGFDGLVVPEIYFDSWDKIRNGRNCILGIAVPSPVLTGGKHELQQYLESNLSGRPGQGIFLTTGWEVPPNTPPDNIYLVMKMVLKGG